MLLDHAVSVRLSGATDFELRVSPRAHHHVAPCLCETLAIDPCRLKRKEMKMHDGGVQRIVIDVKCLPFVLGAPRDRVANGSWKIAEPTEENERARARSSIARCER